MYMRSKTILSILAISFLFVIVLNSVSAEVQTLPTTKQGTCISLLQQCGNCTYSNVTNVLIDSKIAMGQVKMTRNVPYYNYSFCNTSTIGEYIVNGFSDVDGIITPWAYNFIVTSSGGVDNGNNSIAIIIVLVVFAGLFTLIGYSIDSQKWLIKSALYLVALLIMIVTIALGMQLSFSANVDKLIFTALVIGITAFGLFIMYIFVIYFINLIRALKNAKQAQKDSDIL